MKENIIYTILKSVVPLIALITARYLIPLIVVRLKDSKHQHAAAIAAMAVRAAEQLLREAGAGDRKYTMAVEMMKSWGIKLTDDQLQDLIESAVQVMNAEIGSHPAPEYDIAKTATGFATAADPEE